MTRIIAMLPTYNEAENIGPLMDAILAIGPELEVLVVDDDSPDGTWRIVRDRADADPRIHLLHRISNRGRGLAGIAGFKEALRLGADAVIEMDADWSHDPRWIPDLIQRSADADVVIGSRLTAGGSEHGRSPVRRWITLLANAYIQFMLRLPVRDATSGYRLFSRRVLETLPWEAMHATGPETVQEVLLAAFSRGFRIVETPIVFTERRHGQSTFNWKIMVRSLGSMFRLRLRPGRLVPEHWTPRAGGEGAYENLTNLPRFVTMPLSWVYAIGRWGHRGLMVSGPLRRRALPVPVVSVGNLTVGGTGKTPFTQMLANQLRQWGYTPVILSRGYRARQPLERPLIVSDGERILAEPDQSGDEPRATAQQCPGIGVVVHPDRARGGQVAVKLLGASLLILDDGFQHDRLARNLDLVLWDLQDLPERMRLLPAGRLREPLGALRRAGAIVLTHAEYLPQGERPRRIEAVTRELKRHAPGAPIFTARTEIAGFERVSGRLRAAAEGEPEGADWPWRGRKVILVSALARPEGFEAMVRESGGEPTHHFAYPDHSEYDEEMSRHWMQTGQQTGAEMILTTTKDAVKLSALPLFGLTILAVKIAVRITEPDRWDQFLRERLDHGME